LPDAYGQAAVPRRQSDRADGDVSRDDGRADGALPDAYGQAAVPRRQSDRADVDVSRADAWRAHAIPGSNNHWTRRRRFDAINL
jgi:hypothetical protein